MSKKAKIITLEDQMEAGLIAEVVGDTGVYKDSESKDEAFRLRKLEASKRMLERKKVALDKLIALAQRIGTEEEKAAAQYLSGGRQLTTTNQVYDFVAETGKATEDELFIKFKVGRTEMKRLMKKHVSLKYENGAYFIL